jgi:acetylornithine/succinyldiaminopimelate/putrescine aminotransferase/predicted amino acid dehydrogenase
MKFAFLVHPLSAESASLMEMDQGGLLRSQWGLNVLEFCSQLHVSMEGLASNERTVREQPRLVDEVRGLVSATGAVSEGRLYEIPMDALQILSDPNRAVAYMEQAVDLAAVWGAQIVGLGSMTGIVGSQGQHLAQRGPLAITTGNSLTVYAALQNLYHVCAETDVELSRNTVAVIGIPGSIATAAATLLAPQCQHLLLVARQPSPRATKLAEELGAELLFDIPAALARSMVLLTATSTGNCIDQHWLQPGSIVIDVAVPTDVKGQSSERPDALMISGGLSRVPASFPRDSMILGFYQGMVPSCLGETMVLALENRAENFSVGRNLSIDHIQEIGTLAQAHGFDFSQLLSFGLPLTESTVAQFLKARTRRASVPATGNGAGRGSDKGSPASPTIQALADHASQRHAAYINPVLLSLGGPKGLVKTFVRGKGNEVFDADGKAYLDFVAGFGSMNLGHNHPAVVAAITDALAQEAPGFTQSAVNPLAGALAEKLMTLTPAGLEMTFFANSGAEAVEAALKLARICTGRSGLLSCERSYHGKSIGALSVTGNAKYQHPFAPLVPDCHTVTYGDLEALETALATRRFAGFVVEPIQGEGGMIVPPAGYLRAAQDLCRKSGSLLIVDEVQTGLGRTGAWFAVDHEGVEPDVLTLAKSLGGGLMPIGAMITRRDLWLKAYGTVQTFALHTSTFGGGSLACAAGLAALRVVHEEKLIAKAQARGQQLTQGLAALCARFPILKGVRGQGLMLGLELQPIPPTLVRHFKGMDNTGTAEFLMPDLDDWIRSISSIYFMQTLLNAHGIYTQVARSNPQVLRIQPPLTITEEQVQRFLKALEQTAYELHHAIEVTEGILTKCIGEHKEKRSEASAAEEQAPIASK